MGTGRGRTERQADSVSVALVYPKESVGSAGARLDEQDSCPGGTSLLSLSHRGSAFHTVCVCFILVSGEEVRKHMQRYVGSWHNARHTAGG